LVDAVKSTAQIFAKLSLNDKDGVRLDTPRLVPLRLQHIFTDKNGKQKRTRYKSGAKDIFMDRQIRTDAEGDSIPANDKYSDEERYEMYLINGVKVTNDAFVQSFLDKDNNPQREDFTGKNRGGAGPVFKELDEIAIADEEHKFIFDTAKALTKISLMDLNQVQSLVALLFGASYPTPERLKDCQNLCAKSLEGNEERVNLVINGDWGKDGEITVLLNKAINKDVITLIQKEGYVEMKKNGAWVSVKMIVAETFEQKEALFRQFLASEEGELLRKDIEAAVADDTKQESKKPKK
jgi:hypothetical protein